MQVILYIIFIGLLIWLFLALLPIFLILLAFLFVGGSIYMYFFKRKIRKQMEDFNQQNDFEHDQFQYYNASSRSQSVNGDIIDVEFTETEETNN